jgi:hypothetical protein
MQDFLLRGLLIRRLRKFYISLDSYAAASSQTSENGLIAIWPSSDATEMRKPSHRRRIGTLPTKAEAKE